MEKRTAIGLIGCGRWGRFILRDLVSLNCEVWVVVNNNVSDKNAQEYGAHHIVSLLEDLPQHIDGYVVAVPTIDHAQIIEQIYRRKKPIFVEKPLTPDPIAAQKIVDIAGDQVFVMHKWRYHPGVQQVRQLIATKELGKVKTINSIRCQWGSPHADVDPVWILLPHEISIILHLLDEIPSPITSHGEITDEDYFVSLRGQLGQNPACFVEVSSRVPLKQRGLVVTCENGSIMVNDPLDDHIVVRRNNSNALEKIAISTEYPLLRELRAFISYINGGEKPMSTAHEGLLVVQTIAKMRQMAKEVVCP